MFRCLVAELFNTEFPLELTAKFSGASINTLRPRQNGHHFPDDIFKYIFFNENVWIAIKIPLKFVPNGQINNIPALVQIMAWCRPGDKPVSEPMMVRLPTHICVTRPQWVIFTCGKIIWKVSTDIYWFSNDLTIANLSNVLLGVI